MARLLRSCCPCLRRGPGIIERFHHAQDKKKATVDKETKGLLSETYGLDEEVDGGEEGEAAMELQGPISSERIKALLDRQVALTSEIENEFDDDDDEGDDGEEDGADGAEGDHGDEEDEEDEGGAAIVKPPRA